MRIAWIGALRHDTIHKTSIVKMTEELNNLGNEVELFMVKNISEKITNSKNSKFVSIPSFPLLTGFLYGLLVFFYFPLLLKNNFDLIIINCTKVWVPFTIPLKILNIPIIVDIRTLPVDREKSIMFSISLHCINHIADGVSTITEDLFHVLEKRYRLKVKDFFIWSSGVSLKDFSYNHIHKESSKGRRKLNLIYHGAYSPTRGIENLVRALSKIPDSIQDRISLCIVGMPYKIIKKLYDLCDESGIRDFVTIKGKVDYSMIVEYIKKADAGVIPLPPENLWWKVSSPLKTLEYLALGKPIIATNIPFHKELFSQADIGILIDNADPASIADAISKLYDKIDVLNELGLNGRKLVENQYNYQSLAIRYNDFLNSFI